MQNVTPLDLSPQNWRRTLATALNPVFAVANTVFSLQIPTPETLDPANLGIYFARLGISYAPTLIYFFASRYYVGKITEQNKTVIDNKAMIKDTETAAATLPAAPAEKVVSQMDSFNKGIPEMQLKPDFPNMVSVLLKEWEGKASTDDGVFDILMNRLGAIVDADYLAWADAALQTVEALKAFASRYYHVDLTDEECAAVRNNFFLSAIKHAEADKTIVASIYAAYKAGTLGKDGSGKYPVWEQLKTRALYYARKSVIDNEQAKLTSGDIKLAREAMADLGLNDYTQRTATSSQGTWWINLGGLKPVNVAVLAGLNSQTMLSL